MNCQKRPNESVENYFHRLCENKELLDLTWNKITLLMNEASGKIYTESKYRKNWTLYKKGLDDGYRRAIDDDQVLKEQEESLMRIREETVKLRDNRADLQRLVRTKARFENLADYLKDIMQEELPPLEPIKISGTNGRADRELVASLADLHYGAEFENYWGNYSPEIFVQRLSGYRDKLIQIGIENNIKKIHVLGLGDMINGLIHVTVRIQSAEDVIKQVKSVSEYIALFLHSLRNWFDTVEFYSVIGNHGRVNANKEHSMYEENFEDFIPWYIEAKLGSVKGIHVNENTVDPSVAIVDVCGKKVFGVHGDLDSFQNASSKLPAFLKIFPDTIWCGHLHSFAIETKNDIMTIRSGCFSGTDGHSKNLRLTGSASQAVAIYGEEGLVSVYNVKL